MRIMNFRKFYNFLIGVCIVALAISCASTKKNTVTNEQLTIKNTSETKETAPIAKPDKVRPQIDYTLAANNLNEINKYIDDLGRWTYAERVIAPYETIDEAINQDSIKIFHRVIASYNSKNKASKEDANRLNSAIEFLLQKKADVNLLNDDGEDALAAFLKIGSNSSRTLNAYNRNQKHHSAEELEPMVKLFIENGANIKLKDKSGVSTLERIVDFAGIDFIKTLLDNDIEINSALSLAVKHNHFELINYLLDKGAILNTSTEEGKDAFMHATANMDNLELFKSLVDKTTDINVVVVTNSQQRRNALHQLILGLAQQATQNIYLDKAIYLLENGIKVIERDWVKQNEENSMIVLVLANSGFTYEKSEILCKKLIENGANVNLVANIQSPLFILLYRNFRHDIEPLFELFIEKGADVNFVFRGTQTPLDLMTPLLNAEKEEIRNKALKISQILKSKGAKTFTELEK